MLNKTVLTAMILCGSLYAFEGKAVRLPNVSFPVAVDENFPVMQRNCQWCHSFGYVLNQGRQSRAFWQKIVHKMRDDYHAPISETDETIIVKYLFKHYGNGKEK